MRAMEMEDEVMQFQTIILMLMYIERISVEYIIEWLARYANIFKDPLIIVNVNLLLSIPFTCEQFNEPDFNSNVSVKNLQIFVVNVPDIPIELLNSLVGQFKLPSLIEMIFPLKRQFCEAFNCLLFLIFNTI